MLQPQTPDPGFSSAPRTTRSKRIFSPWEICHVTPTFDYAGKVKERLDAIHTSELASEPPGDFEHGVGDVASCPSPPSTPCTSPPPSPQLKPTRPPLAEHFSKSPKTAAPSPTGHSMKSPKTDLDRRKARRKATRILSRNRQRADAAKSFAIDRMRQNIVERYVHTTQEEGCNFNLQDVMVTPRAFVNKRDHHFSEQVYSLDELVGPNSTAKFRLVEWDGVQPTALVNASGRVIGILAGNPGDEDWDDVAKEAEEALEYAREQCTFAPKKNQRSRGDFETLACGVSYGGGQVKPTNVRNMRGNQAVLGRLCKLQCFKRISGFSTSVLATRAPKLHDYYARTIKSVYDNDDTLNPPFPSSVFANATYNMGPCTVCCTHCDQANLTYGVCAITPVGEYNPKTGGHLVLWDLALVIEFPPGSTILIPSAVISHSNTRILPNETRYSFTQYTAGGIFRWVENGFMTAKKRRESLSPADLLLEDKRDARRWEEGVALLPLFKDLLSV